MADRALPLCAGVGSAAFGLSPCQHPAPAHSLSPKHLTRPWPVLKETLALVPVLGGENYPDVHLQSFLGTGDRSSYGSCGGWRESLPWLISSGMALPPLRGWVSLHQASSTELGADTHAVAPCSQNLLVGGRHALPRAQTPPRGPCWPKKGAVPALPHGAWPPTLPRDGGLGSRQTGGWELRSWACRSLGAPHHRVGVPRVSTAWISPEGLRAVLGWTCGRGEDGGGELSSRSSWNSCPL